MKTLSDTSVEEEEQRWTLRAADPARARRFASSLDISEVVASLLIARGVETEEDAR
ncbi:MAG: hypothetical protein H0T60_12860, partial [Acidobacteria bacterium]|nr:hypothetical protein [Acidobacteriota bacterium]